MTDEERDAIIGDLATDVDGIRSDLRELCNLAEKILEAIPDK